MPVRKILRLVCPLLTVGCMGIGFASTGPWIAGLVVVFTLPAWLSAVKWSSGFLPTFALLISVGLAAAGVVTGAASFWMLLSAAFALGGWDGLVWNRASPDILLSTRLTLLERKHYQSLAAALGLALLAILAGRLVRFRIPFGWMVILIILALFSLERIHHTLTA